MPTYQYRCKECGHDLEIVQAFTDDALTECPACQGALKKVYGNVGISFKGSGFYKNDSRSSSATSSSNGSSSSESSSKSSDTSTSSDAAASSSNGADSSSKTETKSETKPKTATSSD